MKSLSENGQQSDFGDEMYIKLENHNGKVFSEKSTNQEGFAQFEKVPLSRHPIRAKIESVLNSQNKALYTFEKATLICNYDDFKGFFCENEGKFLITGSLISGSIVSSLDSNQGIPN